jgi:hypothetical protein
MRFTCPVCYYAGMQEPPMDYNICECCGTEFGNDDEVLSHGELRAQWISNGTRWFFKNPPVGWNPWTQLLEANVGALPYDGAVTYYGGPVYTTTQYVDLTDDALACAA